MKALENLKTVHKLALISIMFMIILVICGALSIKGLRDAGQQSESMYKLNLLPLADLGNLRATSYKMVALIGQHIQADTAVGMAQQDKDIRAADKEIDDLIAKYIPAIVTQAERKMFEQYVEHRSKYQAIREKILDLSRALKKNDAEALRVRELTSVRAAMLDDLKALVEENERQGQETYQRTHELSTEVTTTLVWTFIVCSLLGAGVVWLISKIITKNLGNVLEVATAIKGGHLTTRCTMNAKDEVGQLAEVVNQMALSLQTASSQQAAALAAQAAEISGVTDAISKSQGVIEFDMDGTVLTANDNFLQCMGYSLAEVKGKSHQMFCAPTFMTSGRYAIFWQKMKQGEFDTGIHCWLGRGGKEVWLQAAYTPIQDAQGKVAKVMALVTDVTVRQQRNAEYESKLAAIGKLQAVIEFNLDGTIITANENFLKTVGYSLEEIKGQHHRMFCEPAYMSSPEYAAFWQKLNRGEADNGFYCRLGKGGKQIWLQASYTPIADANGKFYKVVKYASDVTAEKQRNAEFESKLAAIGKLQAMIEFNLDGTILTANDNFLAATGYRLEEIKGQHHRIFCEAAHTASPEYHAFWQKLNRGETDMGVYRRLGKGAFPIWLMASYIPIPDASGRPYKVVKYAINVTEEKLRNNEFEGKMLAVNKAQAIIEFSLDGTIITANDNFLGCVGYSLDEIKGKSHGMFQESLAVASPEYQAFWAKLNRGEWNAGVYRRLGKGGKEVWLQASYTPMVNADGKPYKVVQLATDITEQKRAQNEVETLIKAAALGQLSERIQTESFTGTAKDLTESFNRLLDSVVAPLRESQAVLTALADNDLTVAMTGTYHGEFEEMKISVNKALQNLIGTIAVVSEAVESVTSGSEEITKGNQDLSSRTSEQASSLEETAASMEEMTSTVKQNADNAKRADQLAIAARETADKGGAVTKKAVEAMGEINKSSKKIADIITVIDEIAFQTNLLALNAAVEAARAGEHGRGFAVVAAEVRNLAQRSASAAKEIKGLINESIQRVGDGSDLVNQSGKTLDEIVNSVKRVTDIIAEISAASQEQASGIDQVNKAIMSMDETTQANAALVEETTSAAQSMREQARELMQQVQQFKVNPADRPVAQTVAQHEGYHASSKPVTQATGPKVVAKNPVFGKPLSHKGPAVAVAGSGKDRHSSGDEFEEF